MQVGFPEQRPAGKEWSDLSRQGTGAEQRPRASLHDPAGLALTDVPQAMRAGAAIPKADNLRTRNHPQDMISALTRGLLVALWHSATTGRFRRVSSCVRSGEPNADPDPHRQRSDEPRRTPSPTSRNLRRIRHIWHQLRRVTRGRHAGRQRPPLWSISRGNTSSDWIALPQT